MLDIFGVHGLVLALVALVVIGPKDLPKAMRVLGYWVGRARGVASQFRSGFDNMVREAELAEMEKKWAAENERIMKEHAGDKAAVSPVDAAPSAHDEKSDVAGRPVMVETPHVEPAPFTISTTADKKPSS